MKTELNHAKGAEVVCGYGQRYGVSMYYRIEYVPLKFIEILFSLLFAPQQKGLYLLKIKPNNQL